MNRNQEYEALLRELEPIPDMLDTTVERALKRKKTSQKKRRLLGVPMGSLAACFAAFVVMVNAFPTFAKACEDIPLLRELAEAVSWSPSLSEAVENEFVQPIGQRQTVNGITATIEYLIVDQKQLNIFFTLEGDYENLSAEMPKFTPSQHCSVMGASYREPPGTLLNFTLDYVEGDVPDGFTMTFGVTTYIPPAPGAALPTASIFDEHVPEEPDILAEFTFDLTFDPNFTAKGEVIPVDKTFALGGQTVTITEAEIYPTHARINVASDSANTAWLKGLNFYLENEHGERFDPIGNGITATGSDQQDGSVSYRIESSYFSGSKHLTLYITGATWLDKDKERVPIDLSHGTADWMPESVTFYRAERVGENEWAVQFSAPKRPNGGHYQLFYTNYFDAAGTEYDTHGSSSSSSPMVEGPISDEMAEEFRRAEQENRFFEMLILRDYPYSTVWMRPVFSHRTTEQNPVTILIK